CHDRLCRPARTVSATEPSCDAVDALQLVEADAALPEQWHRRCRKLVNECGERLEAEHKTSECKSDCCCEAGPTESAPIAANRKDQRKQQPELRLVSEKSERRAGDQRAALQVQQHRPDQGRRQKSRLPD